MIPAGPCGGKDFFCCTTNYLSLMQSFANVGGIALRGDKTKGILVLLLFLLTGALLGGLLGEAIAGSSSLAGISPYLAKKYTIFEMAPASINLFVMQIKLGFVLQPNLVSVIGIALALFLFRRF
jgi:hypothetical protein